MSKKKISKRAKRGGSSCAAPLLGAVEPTSRGFERIDFKDHYGVGCSLQASSLAIYATPGTSAVWLGCNDANPRVLVPGQSWQPVKMPADYLADTRMDPTVQLEQSEWEAQNEARLHQALDGLDERSRDILQQRWLADDKMTLQDLADKYQVSAERIRQLEKSAINKLRSSLEA